MLGRERKLNCGQFLTQGTLGWWGREVSLRKRSFPWAAAQPEALRLVHSTSRHNLGGTEGQRGVLRCHRQKAQLCSAPTQLPGPELHLVCEAPSLCGDFSSPPCLPVSLPLPWHSSGLGGGLSLPIPVATVMTLERTGHSALAPKIQSKRSLWGQVRPPPSAALGMRAGLDAEVGTRSHQQWLLVPSAQRARHSRTVAAPTPASH